MTLTRTIIRVILWLQVATLLVSAVIAMAKTSEHAPATTVLGIWLGFAAVLVVFGLAFGRVAQHKGGCLSFVAQLSALAFAVQASDAVANIAFGLFMAWLAMIAAVGRILRQLRP